MSDDAVDFVLTLLFLRYVRYLISVRLGLRLSNRGQPHSAVFRCVPETGGKGSMKHLAISAHNAGCKLSPASAHNIHQSPTKTMSPPSSSRGFFDAKSHPSATCRATKHHHHRHHHYTPVVVESAMFRLGDDVSPPRQYSLPVLVLRSLR